jgi:demethylmenaquinone methyltransferase/2-methoxy-6-polyprenyl-1,4-benzoquinol methylase
MKTDHEQYTRAFFKRKLPRYDLIVAPLRPLRRRVVTMSGAGGGSNILDVACGTGEQSIAFARAGCSVTGVDLSEDMLSKARGKVTQDLNITFECRDASELPYEDGTFDVSSISLGLHDMPQEMGLKVLSEMNRVTKLDGTIIITEHNKSPTLFGSIIHWFMKRFDTRYYQLFIDAGLGSYTNACGLTIKAHRTELFGIIQVAVCAK